MELGVHTWLLFYMTFVVISFLIGRRDFVPLRNSPSLHSPLWLL
jgi:hypothetical protein